MNFKNFFGNFLGRTSSDKYNFSILSGGSNYNNTNSSSPLAHTSSNSPTTPKKLFTNIENLLSC